MVSVVNDACVKCKSCADVCPVDAFHECDTQLVVDPDTCIDCGVCISECPQEAITSAPTPTINSSASQNFEKPPFAEVFYCC